MKNLFCTGILIILSIPIYCQVSSLPTEYLFSGSILMNEIEATQIGFDYKYIRTNQYFGQEGESLMLYSNTDSILLNSNLTFQMSYNISKNIELGIEIPLLQYASRITGKHTLYEKPKLQMGFQVGISLPFGLKNTDSYNEEKFGIFGSWMINILPVKHLNIGFNLGYTTKQIGNFIYTHNGHGFIFTSDAAYSLFRQKLHFQIGSRYGDIKYEQRSRILDLRMGVSFSSNENNRFSLYYTAGFWGRNSLNFKGVGMKWFIIFPDKGRQWLRDNYLN